MVSSFTPLIVPSITITNKYDSKQFQELLFNTDNSI